MTLLVIEDSEEDYEMLKRVVQKKSANYELIHCETGKEALEFFLLNKDNHDNQAQLSKIPSLILLDLNLPGIDGKTVLAKLKSHPTLKLLPIVVFSTSSNPQDIKTCYEKGANAYIIKPMDFDKLKEHIEIILKHWMDVNIISIDTLKIINQ